MNNQRSKPWQILTNDWWQLALLISQTVRLTRSSKWRPSSKSAQSTATGQWWGCTRAAHRAGFTWFHKSLYEMTGAETDSIKFLSPLRYWDILKEFEGMRFYDVLCLLIYWYSESSHLASKPTQHEEWVAHRRNTHTRNATHNQAVFFSIVQIVASLAATEPLT